MSLNIKEVSVDDFIEDAINDINENFKIVDDAISDLQEIINEGELEIKNIKVDAGSEEEQAVNVVGKTTLQGDVDVSSNNIESKTLNIKETSTFNGVSTHKGGSVFNKASKFEGELSTFNNPMLLNKDIRRRLRFIDNESDTIGETNLNGVYQIDVQHTSESNLTFMMTEEVDSFVRNAIFDFLNGIAYQTIKIVYSKRLSEGGIFIKLNNNKSVNLKYENESIELVYKTSSIDSGIEDGWLILSHSVTDDINTRII